MSQAEKTAAAELYSRDILETALAGTDVLIASLDRSFRFRYVNRAFAELVGRPAAELLGRDLFEFYPREGKRTALESVLETGRPTFARAIPTAVSPAERCDWSAHPSRDADHNIDGIILTGNSVSERLTQLARSQHSQSSLKHLYGSRQLLAIRAELETFRILDISQGLAELAGFSDRTQLIGRDIAEFLLYPEDASVLTSMLRQQQVIPERPTALRLADGEIHWVDGTGWVCADGKSVEIVLRDITACRLDHQETADRAKMYRQMFEHRNAVKLIIDPENGEIVDANNAACQFYGYSKAELLHLRITDINIWPKEEVQAEMDRAHAEERTYFRFPHRLADGSVRQVEVYSGPIELSGRRLLHSIIHDITDKIEAEEALRESEKRYRDFVEGTDDLVIQVDAEGHFTFLNDAAARMFGLPVNELLGRSAFDFVHEDDKQATMDSFRLWIESQMTALEFQNRQVGADGRTFHVAWTVNINYDSLGMPTAINGIARDITQLKLTEEALVTAQKQFRAIADYTFDWEHWIDVKGNLLWVNPSVEALTGYSVQECLAMHDYPMPLIEPEDRPRMLEQLARERAQDVEFRIRRKDGEVRWMSTSWQPIRIDGQPAGTRGSICDITARKEIERELVEKRYLFEEVERITDVGWFYFDIATGEAFWSEQMFRIYRVDRETFKSAPANKVFIEMVHPDDRQKMIEMQETCIRDGAILDADFRVVRGDGSIAHIRGAAKTTYDDEGNPLRIVGSNLDVTQFHTMETRLLDHQFVQQEIERVANLGWFYQDLTSGEIYWSDQLYRLFGETPETLRPSYQTFIDFIHPADRPAMKQSFDRLFTEQTMISNEYRIVIRNDEVRTLLGFARMLGDPDGRPYRIVGACIDITDRKRHETEIAKAQKLQSLGSIAGGIAHEFNNLLTGVLGNISLAVSDLDETTESHALLLEAERIAERTRELTSQLLTFSSGGKPVLDETNIGDLVRGTVPLLLKRSNCVADYHLPDNLPTVLADRVQLTQVINNLVLNARDAMEQDGGTIKLSAVLDELGADNQFSLEAGLYICLRVIDHGTGIDETSRGQIFDPFFTTKPTGHGLGLAASYSIAHNHGGHLTLETTSAHGSTFALYLPIAPSCKFQLERDAEQSGEPRVIRVLVMDDEDTLRRLASRVLEREGYVVETAPDGTTAIDMVRRALAESKRYDIAILDLSVPGDIGGDEALTGMREVDPTIKAIVCSGYAEDPVLANYEEYGFDAVLSKPFMPHDLAARVAALAET